MNSASLTGKDTTIIDDRIFEDFGEGDVVSIEFPDDLVEAKVGKNGNVIYVFKNTGKRANVTIRVLLGSKDDKFLNSKLSLYEQNPPAFILMDADFIKKVGDGKGNITNVIYNFSGGLMKKYPGTKENTDGDIEQAIAIWEIIFGNSRRIES